MAVVAEVFIILLVIVVKSQIRSIGCCKNFAENMLV